MTYKDFSSLPESVEMRVEREISEWARSCVSGASHGRPVHRSWLDRQFGSLIRAHGLCMTPEAGRSLNVARFFAV